MDGAPLWPSPLGDRSDGANAFRKTKLLIPMKIFKFPRDFWCDDDGLVSCGHSRKVSMHVSAMQRRRLRWNRGRVTTHLIERVEGMLESGPEQLRLPKRRHSWLRRADSRADRWKTLPEFPDCGVAREQVGGISACNEASGGSRSRSAAAGTRHVKIRYSSRRRLGYLFIREEAANLGGKANLRSRHARRRG